jgi:hypothetical protein
MRTSVKRKNGGGSARSASKAKDGGVHGGEEDELRGRRMRVAR